jgi:predicted nucleotidyltransferase
MSRKTLVHEHRQALLAAAARRGAYNLRVFGSVARGEDGAGSDIDFIVSFEPGRSLFDFGGLYNDLSEILGCEIDLVVDDGLDEHLRQHLLGESIAVG